MAGDTAKPGNRIESLDVLRGLAILGILLINIPGMAASYATIVKPSFGGWTELDRWIWFVENTFFLGTQRGLLELVFGASAAILLSRSLDHSQPVAEADRYFRRNLWLAAFGFFHATLLLWPGDILFYYGFAGLLLFPFRRMAANRLAMLGIAGLLALSATSIPDAAHYYSVKDKVEDIRGGQVPALPAADRKEILEEWKALNTDEAAQITDPAFLGAERKAREGSYAANLGFSWMIYSGFSLGWPYYFSELAEAFLTMLVGMALFKAGVTQGRRSLRYYAILAFACLGAGVPLNWHETAGALAADFGRVPINEVTSQAGRLLLSVGYVALVNLLLKARLGQLLLAPVRACGRMALSCYIGQTLIGMWFLFPSFGIGLGLWGRYGIAAQVPIALGMIGFEIMVCNLWLRRYRTGPLEVGWRRLADAGDERATSAPALS